MELSKFNWVIQFQIDVWFAVKKGSDSVKEGAAQVTPVVVVVWTKLLPVQIPGEAFAFIKPVRVELSVVVSHGGFWIYEAFMPLPGVNVRFVVIL